MITIYRNIMETEAAHYRNIDVVLKRIKEGASKDLVKQIRKTTDKSERNELKKGLPSICFSGVFSSRKDKDIKEHSGFICLDFDGYDTKRELLEDKKRISRDNYVYCVFISPSDKGLKVIVKIPKDIEGHRAYFDALEEHFANPRFDTTSKNISRVCYESYDPLVYVNENSSVWDTKHVKELKPLSQNKDRVTIPITDQGKIVEILMKWWQDKYPMTTGSRNHNIFVIAMAFNEFGVAKGTAEYILQSFAETDFPTSEIMATISSAYARKDKYNTKYYEDEEAVNSVRAKLKRGVPKKEVRHQLENTNIDGSTLDTFLDRMDEEAKSSNFWKKSDRGVIKVVHVQFKEFLEESGFYKYCPEGSKNYVFVKVTNNLIDHTTEKEIKDFVLTHLLEVDDLGVYNYFADNTRFFKEDFLTLLSTIDVHLINDDKSSSFLYYRNCAIKITAKGVEKIDYLDLGGYVWKDHIIDRNYKKCTDNGDYKQFISNICASDKERVSSMESTIGFLLHGYKNPAYCPAVILNDEVISENPEGGTGKGLFMEGITQIKKVVKIDGKHFDFAKSFPYQLVSADTQVMVFDDVKKHFKFERLFSVITEGLTLEKKNKDAIKIDFEHSPKIAITTNYAISGTGNSFLRRKWELEMHPHYKMGYTPLDEFGRMMFGGWDDEEWCRFDNYMIGCLIRYLKFGLKKSSFVNLKTRQLSQSTSHEFIEWCGLIDDKNKNHLLSTDKRVRINDLFIDFIDEYPDFGTRGSKKLSRQRFRRWLEFYAKYVTGSEAEKGRDTMGNWIMFVTEENKLP